MTLVVDQTYTYAGYFGNPAKCRLRIFTDLDRPTVVLVSELPDNPGTSITNRAEELAQQIVAAFGIDPETMLWIEHYPDNGAMPERFRRVVFGPGGKGLGRPKWSKVSKEVIRSWIGSEP